MPLDCASFPFNDTHHKSLSFFAADQTLCGDPEQPVSSQVNRTSANTVEYTCVKGYRMEGGSPKRFCETSGIWSGQPPQCKGTFLCPHVILT